MSGEARLRGRVVDAGGVPVEGAVVWVVEGPPHPDIAAVTGPSGGFELGELEPGRYVVAARTAETRGQVTVDLETAAEVEVVVR